MNSRVNTTVLKVTIIEGLQLNGLEIALVSQSEPAKILVEEAQAVLLLHFTVDRHTCLDSCSLFPTYYSTLLFSPPNPLQCHLSIERNLVSYVDKL